MIYLSDENKKAVIIKKIYISVDGGCWKILLKHFIKNAIKLICKDKQCVNFPLKNCEL